MANQTKILDDLIKQLPHESQLEVWHFAESLLARGKRKAVAPLRQDWAGALRDYRDIYSALDLQKRALEWRGD